VSSKLQRYQEAVRERAALVRLRKEERRKTLLAHQYGLHLDGLADEPIQRVEIVDPQRSSMWTGLAVGLSIAALAGVVIALLLRKSPGPQAPQLIGIPMALPPAQTNAGLGSATISSVPQRINKHPRFLDETDD